MFVCGFCVRVYRDLKHDTIPTILSHCDIFESIWGCFDVCFVFLSQYFMRCVYCFLHGWIVCVFLHVGWGDIFAIPKKMSVRGDFFSKGVGLLKPIRVSCFLP